MDLSQQEAKKTAEDTLSEAENIFVMPEESLMNDEFND